MSQKGLHVLFALKRVDVKGSMLDFCNDFQFGKQVRNSYYSGVSCKPNVLDLVHFDVCSMLVKSLGCATFFISFIDDYSRKIWV